MATAANASSERETTRVGWWVAIVLVAILLGFTVGYHVSSRTGVEPGYFNASEAGSYGVAPTTGPKLSEDLRKHYEGLTK